MAEMVTAMAPETIITRMPGAEAPADQVDTHDQSRGGQQPAGVPDAAAELFLRVVAGGGYQRHHADPGFKSGQAKDQQGEGYERRADYAARPGAWGDQPGSPGIE